MMTNKEVHERLRPAKRSIERSHLGPFKPKDEVQNRAVGHP